MTFTAKKSVELYKYSDYLTWPESERWELIDGKAYNMSPAPSTEHQRILGILFNKIYNYLEGKSCKVFVAPFDIRLPVGNERDEDINTIVQPDIVVICDNSKIDSRGCKGSPDFIIEIVSPNTAKKDMGEKLHLYERVGVKEYWIVYPGEMSVAVYTMGVDNQYGKPQVYSEEDNVRIGIFEELEIELRAVFG